MRQILEPRLTDKPVPYVDSIDISGALGDSHLVRMWLSGRPDNTVRAYQTDISGFRLHVCKPLRQVTAADLIDYAETLAYLATATQHRKLSVVKSLFSFAMKLGYISLDPAAALRLPKPADDRASKILDSGAIRAIIAAAKPGRDRLICETLYWSGVREAELVALTTKDVRQTIDGYTLSILGKGSKQRTIAIRPKLATDLIKHRESGTIFQGARGHRLHTSTIYRIVRKAAESVGCRATPHIFRHAFASHALDGGAPLTVVRDDLGHGSLQTTSRYLHARPSDGASLYINDDA